MEDEPGLVVSAGAPGCGVTTVTIQAKRSVGLRRAAKLARIYDGEIAPCWGSRFARLLVRDLRIPDRGQVLDVSCGTGEPTLEILRRMPDGARLIAIDESSAMLDVVRRKVAALRRAGTAGLFLRSESGLPKLSFADEVYDLVVCNIGLDRVGQLDESRESIGAGIDGARLVAELARVARPRGEVRVTLPLAGTFEEFHDLLREVLVKHDRQDALDRLDAHLASYPTCERAEGWLAAAGLAGGVDVEEFSMLFRSGLEFFYAPVIEYGPLAAWRAIAGDGQDVQDVFWHIRQAIDAYFAGGPFHVTVRAGCLTGLKPAPSATVTLSVSDLAVESSDSAITAPAMMTGDGAPRPQPAVD